MSLLMLSIEYLILSIIFESIRHPKEENESIQDSQALSRWTPLSEKDIENIRKLTG